MEREQNNLAINPAFLEGVDAYLACDSANLNAHVTAAAQSLLTLCDQVTEQVSGNSMRVAIYLVSAVALEL